MPKFPMHSTAIRADLFQRTLPSKETTITAKDYLNLREAAKAKGKLPELATWLRDRKIILKG